MRPNPGRCVASFVEDTAAAYPNAPALRWDQSVVSYRALNEAANGLAWRLKRLGAAPETFVGVCLERGPSLAVALLAVLKSGAAYVPLDPALPQERLRAMLADVNVGILLTQRRHLGDPPTAKASVLCLDRTTDLWEQKVEPNPDSDVKPETAAYVIFTSGSTGRPKGVVLPHRTLSSLIAWQVEDSGSRVGSMTLQLASPSFDVSLQEILATWSAGGCLVCPSEEARRDAAVLVRVIAEQAIHRVFLPYVMLRQLAEASRELPAHRTLALREVISSGEPLKITPAIAEFFAGLEHCRLSNQYGPSETHVVSAFTLPADPRNWPALPPIGRPVAGARLHVLDAQGRPAPTGVDGELHIGGPGVGRGYLNRPDLTADRFLPDPFSAIPGAVLYRTGDRVRLRSDGHLDFLGRMDRQVKIRGFRVELGEVEAWLSRHPAVADAVVVVCAAASGSARLRAYLLPKPGDAPTRPALLEFLGRHLPEHMLPAEFIRLDRFPLTPGGKVDRQRLPEPDRVQTDSTPRRISPRNALEAQVAEIWAEVTSCTSAPGVHENFFDVGGDSLLAPRLAMSLRRRFAVDLPLRCVFDEPTIAGLARVIRRLTGGQAPETPEEPAAVASGRCPLSLGRPVEDRGPLSFQQAEMVRRLRDFPECAPRYDLVRLFDLDGPVDAQCLASALHDVIQRHGILRTTIDGAGEAQVLHDAAVAAVDCRASGARTEDIAASLLDQRHGTREVLAGLPLFRPQIIIREAQPCLLALTIHHLLCDSLALGVLWRDLSECYAARLQRRPPRLPPLPTTYLEYARSQRMDWPECAARALPFWRAVTAGAPGRIAWPSPAEAAPPYATAAHRFRLPHELFAGVRRAARATRVTPFLVLLAATGEALARVAGQDDILLGTDFAHREASWKQNLAGHFLNTRLTRVTRRPERSLREAVLALRGTWLAADDHREAYLDQILQSLGIPWLNSVLQDQDDLLVGPELVGVTVRALPVERPDPYWRELLVSWRLGPDRCDGEILYRTSCVDAAAVEAIPGEISSLLGQHAE